MRLARTNPGRGHAPAESGLSNLSIGSGRLFASNDGSLLDHHDRQRKPVAVVAVQQQIHRNQQIISERDPQIRKKALDAMRKTAADKTSAREHMLRSSMTASMRRAAEIE
jgi:3-(3-hydroxy-phenyl)propionate hydroxylase